MTTAVVTTHAMVREKADIDPTRLTEKQKEGWEGYAADIARYHREMESRNAPAHNYMHHQTDINASMRAILIDWLIEVHLKFKLVPETLFRTVWIIDCTLERKLVIRQKLQLVGVTAMLIAAKFEEVYPPEVKDFVYITDRAYTRAQILSMECMILNALKFRVSSATCYTFMTHFKFGYNAGIRDRIITELSAYMAETCLIAYKMLKYLPSQIAAATLNVAMRTCGKAWTEALERCTGYSEEELAPCIRSIEVVMADVPSNEKLRSAVRKKYAHYDFHQVSAIPIRKLADSTPLPSFLKKRKEEEEKEKKYTGVVAPPGLRTGGCPFCTEPFRGRILEHIARVHPKDKIWGNVGIAQYMKEVESWSDRQWRYWRRRCSSFSHLVIGARITEEEDLAFVRRTAEMNLGIVVVVPLEHKGLHVDEIMPVKYLGDVKNLRILKPGEVFEDRGMAFIMGTRLQRIHAARERRGVMLVCNIILDQDTEGMNLGPSNVVASLDWTAARPKEHCYFYGQKFKAAEKDPQNMPYIMAHS